jgi:phosphoglycerol transferase MdoB-like AlkP superfamily enzyme
MYRSIVCTNAFANGLTSNQGIVAILGSIPPLLDVPFYYSAYGNNQFSGIATILRGQGYSTSFFMGAEFDHFGFGKFTRMTGFNKYYSRTSYENDKDYDGNWGIYDHKFLPYAADILNANPKPFIGVIYNLSTHPPYKIPPYLRDRFTYKRQNAAQNSISYMDYSIKLFFDKIRDKDWYNNTIFVFCSDHSAVGLMNKDVNSYGSFRIPVFIYSPVFNKASSINKPVQQIDIVPTILNMLHYPKPFMSFGKTIFDTSPRYVYNRFLENYQVLDSCFLLGYNEGIETVSYLYNYKEDPLLRNNLLSGSSYAGTVRRLKIHLLSFIQRFNNDVMENRLYIE